MIPSELLHKFHQALPQVREWVKQTLAPHRDRAVPVSSANYPRLSMVFPSDLLNRANAVIVDGQAPFPPLSRMGLPEFAPFEAMPISGVTYNDTFFVSRGLESESLYFHEMVHVVQWERLGVDNFLLAYGIGLMQSGYRHSPLEEMAYSLQEGFDRGACPEDLIAVIHQRTDAIWEDASTLLKHL